MYEIKCVKCGNTFPSIGKNASVCPDCKKKYLRDYARDRRAKQRELQNEYEADRRSRTAEQSEEIKEQKEIDRIANLRSRAEQGDLYARRSLAFIEGDTLNYWLLLKDIVLQNESIYGIKSFYKVGDVEIHSPEYEGYIREIIERNN